MPSATEMPIQECNCLALRQAARHVTQFYDQRLALAQSGDCEWMWYANMALAAGAAVVNLPIH